MFQFRLIFSVLLLTVATTQATTQAGFQYSSNLRLNVSLEDNNRVSLTCYHAIQETTEKLRVHQQERITFLWENENFNVTSEGFLGYTEMEFGGSVVVMAQFVLPSEYFFVGWFYCMWMTEISPPVHAS